jgi:hypothetical protein
MIVRCSLLGWLLIGSATFAADAADAVRGRLLFEGQAELPARIAGQDFALPAQASRCINCHGASAAGTQRIGPILSAVTLAEPLARRGGPPSRYDAASLCKLLRSGIDPAHVLIPRTMPRYEINDVDCRSLWLHLMAR